MAKQVIVIVGATSGIGLVITRAAVKGGAAVFLIARNAPRLANLTSEIVRAGGRAAFAIADVGDERQVHAAATAAVARYGRIDTWVNSAGVAIYAPLLTTPTSEHRRLMDTNYWGLVFSCQAAVPHMRTRGGAIITVGSVASDIGTPLLGAYAASKHAVLGYLDSLRIELLAEGSPICITLIKPSGIGTPLAGHAANHTGYGARIPPPAYDPSLVAEAVLSAATQRKREVIVGGVGALQVWGRRLAPSLSDLISSRVGPLLIDKQKVAPVENNLFAPMRFGRERSTEQSMLRHSVYTQAVLHPRTSLLIGGFFLVALVRLLRPRRVSRP